MISIPILLIVAVAIRELITVSVKSKTERICTKR